MSSNENKLITIQQNWDTIIQTIIQDMELTPTSYNLWLLPLKPAAFENDTLTVSVTDTEGKVTTYQGYIYANE